MNSPRPYNALAAWGIAPGDRWALEALPVETILTVDDEQLMTGVDGPAGFPWVFTRDPGGLDVDGLEAVRLGRADGVDLIVGWTVDEYQLRWLTEEPGDAPAPRERMAPAAGEPWPEFTASAPAVVAFGETATIEPCFSPEVRALWAHARDEWIGI